MQHIGIVGVSSEGAALCYRTICSEDSQYCGPWAHPKVSMHTSSFADFKHCIDTDDWPAAADILLHSANTLA